MTAYFDAFRRYFDFSGRSTRSQYWLFTLFYAIILFAALMLDGALETDPTGEVPIIAAFVQLAHIIPALSVTVRRLHDTDRSGWFLLLGIIPVIGQIALLVFLCTRSTGPNRYGVQAGGMVHQQLVATMETPLAASSNTGQLDQLEKLVALKNAGTIDEVEFGRMKADLLAQQRT